MQIVQSGKGCYDARMENDDFSSAGLGLVLFVVAAIVVVGGLGFFVLGLIV